MGIKSYKVADLLPFSTSTTGMSYYDDIIRDPEYFKDKKGMIGEIEWMSPSDYLQRVYSMFKKPLYQVYLDTDEKLVANYAKLMQDGEKFPMLTFEPQKGNQEGRHRALAAQKLGIKSVPVFVVEHI